MIIPGPRRPPAFSACVNVSITQRTDRPQPAFLQDHENYISFVVVPVIHACSLCDLLATNSHRLLSSAGSCSASLPLIVRSFVFGSWRAMRCCPFIVYSGQIGERSSLNVFGSPARTKESQYAMSSSANARSRSVCGSNVVVPLNLLPNVDEHHKRQAGRWKVVGTRTQSKFLRTSSSSQTSGKQMSHCSPAGCIGR